MFNADRHDEANSFFRNFAKASKNIPIITVRDLICMPGCACSSCEQRRSCTHLSVIEFGRKGIINFISISYFVHLKKYNTPELHYFITFIAVVVVVMVVV